MYLCTKQAQNYFKRCLDTVLCFIIAGHSLGLQITAFSGLLLFVVIVGFLFEIILRKFYKKSNKLIY